MDHYEVLGVAPDATADEIRAAYRHRARLLHPDRRHDAPPDEQARADEAMALLNQAWTVLGQADRRAEYDRARRRAPEVEAWRPVTSADEWGDDWVDHDSWQPEGPLDTTTRLVRSAPWAIVVLALVAVAVGSLFAGSVSQGPAGGASAPVTRLVPLGARRVCVDPVPGIRPDDTVPCDAPGARRIHSYLPDGGTCPRGTEAFAEPGVDQVLCLIDP